MARNETEREDLMQEAISLVRRLECRCASRSDPLTIGFNALGWLFVYLGNDPMYRFDEVGRLRRAFVDGLLYRTQGNTLAKMQRQRVLESDDPASVMKTTLVRQDLSSEELQIFQARMNHDIEECLAGIQRGKISRRHPLDDLTIVHDVAAGLQSVLDSEVFLAPAIVRR